MPGGVQLLLTLVLIGGCIAYLGDWMGSKIGKKRISIFGLRPRHTSIVMTVITGIVIAVSTFIILSLVSSEVRQGLFQLDELKDAEKRRQVLSRQIKEKEETYKVLSEEFRHTKMQLDAVEKSYFEYQEKLLPLMIKYEKLAADYKNTSRDLDRLQILLAETNKEFEEVKKKRDFYIKQSQRYQKMLGTLTDTINQLTSRKDKLQKEVYHLTQAEIIFSADQIFYLSSIKCRLSIEQTREQIRAVLRHVDELAVSRGASGIDVMDAEVINSLAKQVTSAKTEKGVLVFTLKENALRNKPISLSIVFMPDEMIFKKGQIIMQSILDGTRPAEELLDQLSAMLVFVRENAFRAGMAANERNELGEIGGRQSLSQIQQMLSAGKRQYLVQVVVLENAWRTRPPLKIKFQLKPYKK